MVGQHYGEELMTMATQKLHEMYGENTPALAAMHALVDQLRPHERPVEHALTHGVSQLEHPRAQRMLDHARDAMHQTQVAHEVVRNVDVNLAAPVLNTMLKLGGAETVAEAAHELGKLGSASDTTYGKAATDMAAVLKMGERLNPQQAADFLDRESSGSIVPQYGVHASNSAAPGALAERASRGEEAAQHALLTQSSLVFTPQNEAAAVRLSSMIEHELPKSGAPDWKGLDSQLGAAMQALARESTESLHRIPVPVSQVHYEATHARER
jgi:hypothetical protein